MFQFQYDKGETLSALQSSLVPKYETMGYIPYEKSETYCNWILRSKLVITPMA